MYSDKPNFQISVIDNEKAANELINIWEQEQLIRLGALKELIKKKELKLSETQLFYIENKEFQSLSEEEKTKNDFLKLNYNHIATKMKSDNQPLKSKISMEKFTDLENIWKFEVRLTSLTCKVEFEQTGQVIIQTKKRVKLFTNETGNLEKDIETIQDIDLYEVEILEWRAFSARELHLKYFEPNIFVSFEENNFITTGHLIMGEVSHLVNIVISTQPHFYDKNWYTLDDDEMELGDDFDKMVDSVLERNFYFFYIFLNLLISLEMDFSDLDEEESKKVKTVKKDDISDDTDETILLMSIKELGKILDELPSIDETDEDIQEKNNEATRFKKAVENGIDSDTGLFNVSKLIDQKFIENKENHLMEKNSVVGEFFLTQKEKSVKTIEKIKTVLNPKNWKKDEEDDKTKKDKPEEPTFSFDKIYQKYYNKTLDNSTDKQNSDDELNLGTTEKNGCKSLNVEVKMTNISISSSLSIDRHVPLDILNEEVPVKLWECDSNDYFEPVRISEKKYFLSFVKENIVGKTTVKVMVEDTDVDKSSSDESSSDDSPKEIKYKEIDSGALEDLYQFSSEDELIIGNLLFKNSLFDKGIFYEFEKVDYNLFNQISKLESSEILKATVESNFSKKNKFNKWANLPDEIDQLQYINFNERNSYVFRFEVKFLNILKNQNDSSSDTTSESGDSQTI
jgi:hypothetical protein